METGLEKKSVSIAMAKQLNLKNPHFLVIPFPSQGHINPMLQFSKRLQLKGAQITFVTTNFISKTSHSFALSSNSFSLHTISDGFGDGGFAAAETVQVYLDSFRRFGSQTLRELIQKLFSSGNPVGCVVYDGFLPWVLEIAKEFELIAAVYFTQSCAVANIYYHVHRGLLELPLPDKEILLPGLPSLQPSETPSLIYDFGSFPAFFDLVVNQYANVDKADWILCNTFYELEQEVLEWLKTVWPMIRSIGPSIPSAYLDGRIEGDRDYGFHLYNPDIDRSMKWLDGREKGSVVYVSFGSFAEIETEQMVEMAEGLKMTNCNFLWVVRKSEEAKLPKNFVDETKEKGLVVTWCSQLEVLSHNSISCFVTHCGWNSTLEAMSLGVPMMALPRWLDQNTNAKYITDVWKVGLKPSIDNRRIVRRETVMYCLRTIIEGERGNEIRTNANKLKFLAKRALDHDGFSDKCIDEILAKMVLTFN